mgnify:CR=1 FL=1
MANFKPISQLLEEYQDGYSLEQEFYKNPDIYQKEIENIFLHHWLFAGHTSQIPKTGDYFLCEFDKESIIVIRTKDGSVKAHLNVCRHRGSHICLEKQGTAKSLTCPYHAWTYNLNGDLIAARNMADDFDPLSNGLHSANVEMVGGLIFVSLAKDPPSLKGMQDDLKDVFDVFGFDNMKLAKHTHYPIQANWKLVVENYQECYHCAPSHKDFAKVHAMAQSLERFDAQKEAFIKNSDGYVRTKVSPFYFDQAKDGEEGYQYDRNPLLTGRKSGSKGGKPVAPLLGKLKVYEEASSEFMVGPITFFLIYDDHMLAYRFLPETHETSHCDLYWFVRDDAVEGKDYDLEELTWLWQVTILDDEKIIENNQKGVDSRYYTPGRLSEWESFPQHFLNFYLNSLKK